MIGDRWNWKANFHFHLEMSQRFWQRAKLESPVFNQVYQVDQSFASARHPQRVINRYVLVTFITFTANDDVALRAFRSSLFNSMPRSIHRSGANIKLEFFFVSVEKKINFQYSNFSRFQIFFPSFWNHYYYLYRYNIGWNYWDKLVKKKRVKARKEAASWETLGRYARFLCAGTKVVFPPVKVPYPVCPRGDFRVTDCPRSVTGTCKSEWIVKLVGYSSRKPITWLDSAPNQLALTSPFCPWRGTIRKIQTCKNFLSQLITENYFILDLPSLSLSLLLNIYIYMKDRDCTRRAQILSLPSSLGEESSSSPL